MLSSQQTNACQLLLGQDKTKQDTGNMTGLIKKEIPLWSRSVIRRFEKGEIIFINPWDRRVQWQFVQLNPKKSAPNSMAA